MAAASAVKKPAGSAQASQRQKKGPRSVEEAFANVLIRLCVILGIVGLCLVVLPVWGIALTAAYAHHLAAGRVTYGREWLPRVALAALAGSGLVAGWWAGLDPHDFLALQGGTAGAFWAGTTLAGGMPPDVLTGQLRDYAGAVWSYALAWGPALGGGLLVADHFISFNDGFSARL